MRKKFRDLSKSQKNKRIRKLCSTTYSPNKKKRSNENMESSLNERYVVPDEFNLTADNQESEYHSHPMCDISRNEIREVQSEVNNKMKTLHFKQELQQWVCKFNISHEATTSLLQILKNVTNVSELHNLPSNSRTLLHTPKDVPLRDVPPGKYFHYGLKNAIVDQLMTLDINQISRNIEINVNIDGLPLTKSSKSQFYPILGQIYPTIDKPFIIGVYHGFSKPQCPNIFLKDFIEEYKTLHEEGFQFNNNLKLIVTIRAVICDTPARSFITCTKGFNGYFGCSKCMQEGQYISHRMTFRDLYAKLRTDKNFIERENEDHHNGISIFEGINIGMVSQFPLDYMHLVCLGVVKKMLQIFVNGNFKPVKFSGNMIKEISANLNNISKWIPSEFARKTRTLYEIDRWKATEFRLFLLYIGPVILQNYLSAEYMLHFNALHCAMRILCHETDCINNNAYATDLLIYFVKACIRLYGDEFIIYNVHNLIHLSNDVAKFGNLDSFSSFPFESFLCHIKKLLKKGEKSLQQLFKRIVEHAKCNWSRETDVISKPQVANLNVKKSEKMKTPSYDTIIYNDFILSAKRINNNFCYLKNYSILSIINICTHNNKIILKGKVLLNPLQLEHYPMSSLEFNIVVGNEWSDVQIFNSDDVYMKAVCIPYKNSFCFMPLIHTAM